MNTRAEGGDKTFKVYESPVEKEEDFRDNKWKY